MEEGGQMAERLENRAINEGCRFDSWPCENDVVSLGKALHLTCLGGMSLYLL